MEYIAKKRREDQIAQARVQRLKNQRQRTQRREFGALLNEDAVGNENEQSTLTNMRSSNSTSQNDLSENTSCVICLTNPRELVLLDCGHVCLCMDCFGKCSEFISN